VLTPFVIRAAYLGGAPLRAAEGIVGEAEIPQLMKYFITRGMQPVWASAEGTGPSNELNIVSIMAPNFHMVCVCVRVSMSQCVYVCEYE